MSHSPKSMWLPDERVVEVAPRFSPRVDDPTPRRLNYFEGRTLDADALKTEQRVWDRKVALISRALNPGVQEGLEVELLSNAPGAQRLRITPGRGLTVEGEDVILRRPLQVELGDIRQATEALGPDFAGTAETAETEVAPRPVGLVGLFLKPVRIHTSHNADPDDPCPIDPEAYAYDDLVRIDATELVWARLDQSLPVDTIAGPDGWRDLLDENGDPLDPALAPLAARMVREPVDPLLETSGARVLPATVRRNLVAYRLFQEEESATRRRDYPYWMEHGLPVAMLDIASDGQIISFDRFTVARFGGSVRHASPGASFGFSETYRRARFDQFVDHLQTLRSEGVKLTPATRHFRTLPPVGVIPAALFDTENMATEFFPENFVIEAAPVQLDQMEALLAARAGLEPFDLSKRDYVQLLVPVPDHLFDPKLLLVDEIGPDFQLAIDEATARETSLTAELTALNGIEPFVVGTIEIEGIEPKPRPATPAGSDAADYKDKAGGIIFDLESSFAQVPLSANEIRQLRQSDYETAAGNLSNGLEASSSFEGLKPFAEALSERLDAANDFVDASFLKLQSDIYRLRKQLAGAENATRLATSPVLANLALDTTALVSSKLFGDVAEAPVPETDFKFDPDLLTNFGFTTVAPIVVAEPTSIFALEKPLVMELGSINTTAVPAYTSEVTTYFGKAIEPIAPTTKGFDFFGSTAFTKSFAPEPKDLGITGIKNDLRSNIVKSSDVAWHGLIYGKASPVRTITVAERLRPSPAQEAKNAAVAHKADILRGIQELPFNLAGLPVPMSAGRIALIEAAEFDALLTDVQSSFAAAIGTAVRNIMTSDYAVPLENGIRVLNQEHVLQTVLLKHPVENVDLPASTISFNKEVTEVFYNILPAFFDLRIGLDFEGLAGLILSDRLDPDPANPDEAAYFAAAVDALETAVSMLRLFEGRLAGYSAFLDTLRTSLVAAFELAETWRDQIDEVEAELAEAVHDKTAATALKLEEDARIMDINQRRRDILDKHVDLVAFARPMFANRLTMAPVLDLYRPLSEILPACLESDAELPEELEHMVEALRDAPVGWFPRLDRYVDRIKLPSHFLKAWYRSQNRAQLWIDQFGAARPTFGRAVSQNRVVGKASSGVMFALSAFHAKRVSMLRNRLIRDVSKLRGVGWKALARQARSELSIEDLDQCGKAGRALSKEGLEMLEQIAAVGGCFLEGLRQVPGAIRLIWADTMSEHDKAPDLSHLSRAQGWTGIPFEERRELEHMHAWLFAQIDRNDTEARAMMSEFIRVCMLMSSHAPVSSIVEGVTDSFEQSGTGKTVTKGESFEVSVKKGVAQAGMTATIAVGNSHGLGVVEDLVGTRALVRVTSLNRDMLDLTAATKVTFNAPKRITLAEFDRTK